MMERLEKMKRMVEKFPSHDNDSIGDLLAWAVGEIECLRKELNEEVPCELCRKPLAEQDGCPVCWDCHTAGKGDGSMITDERIRGEILGRLRNEAESQGSITHAAAADELETLWAIVDKVPKTADGVHWIPVMDVKLYHPDEPGPQDDIEMEDGRWVVSWWILDRSTGGSTGQCYDIGDCFSTPEAARAARDAARKKGE